MSPNPHPPTPGRSALGRFAGGVLRHRRAIAALWLALLVLGMAAAGRVSDRLHGDFSLPGQPGYETAQRVDALYRGTGETTPSIIVVTAPAATPAGRSRVGTVFADLRRRMPQLRVVDHAATGDPRFVTRDGATTFALVFPPQDGSFGVSTQTKAATAFVARSLPGDSVSQTGLGELSSQGSKGGSGVLAETLVGAVGALLVLAFIFASALALLPLMIAAVSILSTLLVVFGLSYVANVSFIVEFLVSLVGLGVAIDYSLLLVTRWREERDRGRDNHAAVVAAMTTAGRAVLLSGVTVAIGLVALVVLPVPGLRSVGWGGMLIPVVSVAVTLTLLPAFLGAFGPLVDRPRLRHEAHASRAWSWWARRVVRHRVIAAVAGVAVLGVLIVPALGLTTGDTSPDALAQSGRAHAAYVRLVHGGVPPGVLTPVEALVRSDARAPLRSRLAGVPGIATVAAPRAADDNRGGTSVLVAIPKEPTLNGDTLAPVRAARSALDGADGAIGVFGEGAIELDYAKAVYGSFPAMFGLIAVLTFIVLTRAFRSPLLAAKAIVLNLLSLGATMGLMTWFWQDGHGSEAVFGIAATGAIQFWLPLMVFAFLFGLSMDYEVFILSRMREEYERTGSTDAAVIEGLGRTGRLVTGAALILFLAFASLASAPSTDLKVMATGLGAGILLDATIVRALLLPASVALFGSWNWWLPRPVARVLRVPAPVPAGESAGS